jgi:hypothetical protein
MRVREKVEMLRLGSGVSRLRTPGSGYGSVPSPLASLANQKMCELFVPPFSTTIDNDTTLPTETDTHNDSSKAANTSRGQ